MWDFSYLCVQIQERTMDVVQLLQADLHDALAGVLGVMPEPTDVAVTPTKAEFVGDYTLVVFPWVKRAQRSPEQLAIAVGDYLLEHSAVVEDFNVVKGFLNITIRPGVWVQALREIPLDGTYGFAKPNSSGQSIMVEYSSPNTNKPLHLGHIRNILLGHSVSQILAAIGHRVIRANLVNDRGIHICKSMVAWLRYGHGETPQSSHMKGDHLIGKYYVRYDQEYRREVQELIDSTGCTEEEAKSKASILQEAQEMLRRWEAQDPDILSLWRKMNGWVYEGFDTTYSQLGVGFDRVYYESETYLAGRTIVLQGLERGIFTRREDGSVWIDLRSDGLDQKLLLRSDGTTVYMTQDLGTATQRFHEYALTSMVYVVGNEQDYHFQVLRLILKHLGYDWADRLYHLSYGMVNLPEGKMKSREGTVVDADDLIAQMDETARATAAELGKAVDLPEADRDAIHHAVGLGALKYFILKVDPTKTMVFDPKESIDFNGNTGPFIQYTHARGCSVLRKLEDGVGETMPQEVRGLSALERNLIRGLAQWPQVLRQAAEQLSPALVANYAYELARYFNQFYHDCPIAKEPDQQLRAVRIASTRATVAVLKAALKLLGIHAPELM